MTDKRCPSCEEVKRASADPTLSDFHKDRARKDGFQLWCKVCCRTSARRREGARRYKTVRRVLRVRANNRAMAELRRRHRDEFDAIFEECLDAALEQHEAFLASRPEPEGPDPDSPGQTTATVVHPADRPPTRLEPAVIPLLRSGPPVPGEDVLTRLLPNGEPGSCGLCRSRHDKGHQCPICGSRPQVAVQVDRTRRAV